MEEAVNHPRSSRWREIGKSMFEINSYSEANSVFWGIVITSAPAALVSYFIYFLLLGSCTKLCSTIGASLTAAPFSSCFANVIALSGGLAGYLLLVFTSLLFRPSTDKKDEEAAFYVKPLDGFLFCSSISIFLLGTFFFLMGLHPYSLATVILSLGHFPLLGGVIVSSQRQAYKFSYYMLLVVNCSLMSISF